MALVVARRHDVLVLALDDHELPLHLVRRANRPIPAMTAVPV